MPESDSNMSESTVNVPESTVNVLESTSNMSESNVHNLSSNISESASNVIQKVSAMLKDFLPRSGDNAYNFSATFSAYGTNKTLCNDVVIKFDAVRSDEFVASSVSFTSTLMSYMSVVCCDTSKSIKIKSDSDGNILFELNDE
jgi:hypothetical protein